MWCKKKAEKNLFSYICLYMLTWKNMHAYVVLMQWKIATLMAQILYQLFEYILCQNAAEKPFLYNCINKIQHLFGLKRKFQSCKKCQIVVHIFHILTSMLIFRTCNFILFWERSETIVLMKSTLCQKRFFLFICALNLLVLEMVYQRV